MADTPPNLPTRPGPNIREKAQAEREARLAREAAALRANLRKRKDQARARVAQTDGDAPSPALEGGSRRER